MRGPGEWKGGNGTHVANAGAILNELEAEDQATKILIARGEPTSPVKLLKTQKLRLAERVGFAPLLVVANKELNGLLLPHDPLDPHESPGRDTY